MILNNRKLTEESPQDKLINMLDIFEFYNQMERNKIMLSFKGDITSELLTSILQIMESKLDNMREEPKIKKKVYNVLVECLQNLYHHLDVSPEGGEEENKVAKSAIFMIGKYNNEYNIITGNYILTKNVDTLKDKLDKVNGMDKEQLKEYYKQILSEGEFSAKGGGGLGMIDIARKSGQKLNYNFKSIDNTYSFFSLNIKIS